MRVLGSGDHHFDAHSRFDECIRVHQWMVDLARDEGIDLFVSGGDIYERASTPAEREAVAEWLTAMADVCPVVVSKGNHDRSLDVHLMRRLRSTHRVIVEERAAVHHVAGAAVGAVAWPERRHLLAQSGSSEQASADVRDALQGVLRGIGAQLEHHDGPRILLGHFMVDGSVVSTGQPLLGQPINVGLTDLALARAHLGIMGHIHKAQCFDVAGAPHWYTGSPFRTDFGQLERKVVLLAEFDGARLVSVDEIETPARGMVHVEADWTGDHLSTGHIKRYYDAEIRLRYSTPIDRRDDARRQAEKIADELKEAGAYSVKLEERVIAETRARLPEVAQATGVADKLTAYWKATGFQPGERRDPLMTKLDQLQREDAA